jgi:hypothetical protein
VKHLEELAKEYAQGRVIIINQQQLELIAKELLDEFCKMHGATWKLDQPMPRADEVNREA